MDIDAELRKRIHSLIQERLGENLDAKISVDSIEIMESLAEIRILVRIETDEAPAELAKRYFGLTSRVREALGDTWQNYFPVITPNIGHASANA